MKNEEMLKYNKNRKIIQIGFIVYNLEKTMDMWIENLNIGPWRVLELNEKNTKDVIEEGVPSDKPFKFKVAIALMADGLQMELIQPCYGVRIYEEWLEKYGEGFNHLKEYTPDVKKMEQEVKAYMAKGVPLVRAGNLYGDLHRYMDFRNKFRFVWELGNCPEDIELPEGMVSIYPPEK